MTTPRNIAQSRISSRLVRVGQLSIPVMHGITFTVVLVVAFTLDEHTVTVGSYSHESSVRSLRFVVPSHGNVQLSLAANLCLVLGQTEWHTNF